jgi:hypothetical protein
MAEIATPMFGYKSHIGIDQRHGFIRTWGASDAARYDGRELPNLIDPTNTGSAIWADTAYRSQKNERAILRAGRVSKIHFRRAPGKPLPTQRQRANAARSKVRSAVEHVFATQKHRMGLFIRTIGIERARVKIRLANIAFNFKRFIYWETRASTTCSRRQRNKTSSNTSSVAGKRPDMATRNGQPRTFRSYPSHGWVNQGIQRFLEPSSWRSL